MWHESSSLISIYTNRNSVNIQYKLDVMSRPESEGLGIEKPFNPIPIAIRMVRRVLYIVVLAIRTSREDRNGKRIELQ
ncbi:MAG: hypothetical protein COA38_06975 [Fluviicola sp.]|nr:MAG: hypothetical protein COA38_06975 [Fluviicola sp.]